MIEKRRANKSDDYYGVLSAGVAGEKKLYETQDIVSDHMRLVQTWTIDELANNRRDIISKAGDAMSMEERRELMKIFKEPEPVELRGNTAVD